MAVTCYERYKSVSETLGESLSIGFVVQGTTSAATAITQVIAETPPAVVSGSVILARQPLKVTEEGNGIWYVDVDYKAADSEEDKRDDDEQATPLAFKLSWDTGGGTAKITESIRAVTGGGNYQNSGNTIGWDGKKVNGAEGIVPQLNITVDVFYVPAAITAGAVMFWARSTGKTNSDTWLTFEPGECLLLGCSGEQTFSMLNGRSTKPVPVSFKVGCSENIPAPFTIKGTPDLVSNLGKKGWEYLDVFYGEKTVGTAPNQITVPVPESFKIHQVYRETSFRNVMGIG